MQRFRTMLALCVGVMLFSEDIRGQETGTGPEIVFRLVHPDRQAATILHLFEGCRVPHPAAALAAWKRATGDPKQLGKPIEAVISFFNPEMVREWGVLHEAEFQLRLDPEDGSARWRFAAPRDDGTLAALITALRLTGGGDEAPLADGRRAVERLGGPGAAVATRGETSPRPSRTLISRLGWPRAARVLRTVLATTHREP